MIVLTGDSDGDTAAGAICLLEVSNLVAWVNDDDGRYSRSKG